MMIKLLFLIILSISGYILSKEIIIHKPTPCHQIKIMTEDNNTLFVYLEKKSYRCMCVQKITEEKILVPSHIKIVNVFLNNKLWKEYHIK